jgi:predicted house-cleaning noncanonical NTP pyrophosphatase (MazG superfamily)
MKKYDKLVRDKIPEICLKDGAVPRFRVLSNDKDYLNALLEKLLEESNEVKNDPTLGELADVLEVLQSIGKALGYSVDQIEQFRISKAKERGGFDKRIFLESTD